MGYTGVIGCWGGRRNDTHGLIEAALGQSLGGAVARVFEDYRGTFLPPWVFRLPIGHHCGAIAKIDDEREKGISLFAFPGLA